MDPGLWTLFSVMFFRYGFLTVGGMSGACGCLLARFLPPSALFLTDYSLQSAAGPLIHKRDQTNSAFPCYVTFRDFRSQPRQHNEIQHKTLDILVKVTSRLC